MRCTAYYTGSGGELILTGWGDGSESPIDGRRIAAVSGAVVAASSVIGGTGCCTGDGATAMRSFRSFRVESHAVDGDFVRVASIRIGMVESVVVMSLLR